jgi:hypothetical protein
VSDSEPTTPTSTASQRNKRTADQSNITPSSVSRSKGVSLPRGPSERKTVRYDSTGSSESKLLFINYDAPIQPQLRAQSATASDAIDNISTPLIEDTHLSTNSSPDTTSSFSDVPIFDPFLNCVNADTSTDQKVEWVMKCLKQAGFEKPSDFMSTILTAQFKSRTCKMWQEDEWEIGLPSIILRAADYARKKTIGPNTSHFTKKVVATAETILAREFTTFCSSKDERPFLHGSGNRKGKAPPTKPYLAQEAKDVKSSFFHSHMVTDMASTFEEKVNWLYLYMPPLGYPLNFFRYLFCGIYSMNWSIKLHVILPSLLW